MWPFNGNPWSEQGDLSAMHDKQWDIACAFYTLRKGWMWGPNEKEVTVSLEFSGLISVLHLRRAGSYGYIAILDLFI
jgi:hypothetical protein